MAFSFDTSGDVWFPNDHPLEGLGSVEWSDLSPFDQGMVAGMMGELKKEFPYHVEWGSHFPAFSDIHPDALARLIKDGARELSDERFGTPNTVEAGRAAWAGRQNRSHGNEYHASGFPPLRIFIREGRICLEDAQ